jgi:hypothetical protein
VGALGLAAPFNEISPRALLFVRPVAVPGPPPARRRGVPAPLGAAFAELERDIIHERTMAGLAAAWAQRRTARRDGRGQAGRRQGTP